MAAMARRAKPELLGELEHAQSVDARLRELTSERNIVRAQINALSKDVATLRRSIDDSGIELIIAKSRELGESEKTLASEFDEATSALREILLQIPNIPSFSGAGYA